MSVLLQVRLGERAYPIHVGAGLLGRVDLQALAPGRQVLIATDSNVAPLYLDAVRARLPDRDVAAFVLPAGEQEKTLARFGDCVQALAQLGARRDATIIALGGGVVGDLAGFAAAVRQFAFQPRRDAVFKSDRKTKRRRDDHERQDR